MNAQPGDDEPVRIGLALGGGAVRGAAHVGVLDVLDAAGLAPAVIAGTSAGALIGALYAAGTGPSEISKVAQALRWSRLIRPARTRRALFAIARLGAFLDDLLGGRDFDALDLPFAAVACELTTGDRVVLRDGPVASAVLASAAIPGVFPPVERDGRLLVDGSLVDIVPAGLAREMGADVVVAVDVSGPLPRRPPATLLHIMVAVSTLPPGGGRLGADADLTLAPAVDEYAFWELSRITEFEDAGRAAAEDAVPLIRSLVATAAARRAWERTVAPPPQ
ncbi:patatin-like phospholipase family protein [Pseudosporangium ferrugineum]|uniref:NTE family protein n=1 Tax=Pseudosporangium ferrugineum TaxID=439699 RepID=A0A2T0RK80_9ACTN|nr:patatin-like phospholipase family protein [Pseudosporangium ferrugineum]PRY21595.1 NTE family protein [Pseudosporangium ferrugineum]